MPADLLLTVASIAALLILAGFFSGSETALTAASRARMHRLEKAPEDSRRRRRARTVNRLIGEKERLIGGILLGNNLVNILASALATGLFISLFGDAGIAYATLAMTALVLIFAEVLPKTYAIANPDRSALSVAPAISAVVFLLAPVVRAVQAIVRGTLRVAGIDIDARQDVLSAQEELRGAIELHVREGAMIKLERDMLSGILDLGEVKVEDVMVHRKNMMMIDISEPPARIIDIIVNSPYTRFPLWHHNPDNIVGVLHAKDLLRAVRRHSGDLDTLDVNAIATEPWFAPETTTLREQLSEFRRRRAHFGLVVDEYGALMGLVTLEDILEEIVGEITDEHDITRIGVRTQGDDTLIVDGTVTVRDLNRRFDWNLPDEVATTIAGLVIHEARTIPEPRQIFVFHRFKFEILRRKRNQITLLRITPPAPTGQVRS
ncbi:MAG: HlyC/CorC family transporter [Sphingomonadales bacterium]